jgi:predicted transcriptional regulator
MEEDVLDLENRRRIFQFVSRFQGTHLRQIQRSLELEIGVLDYHLDYLEKSGLITSKKEKYRKRFFTKALSPKDKLLLGVLRQGALRRILIHILLNPGCTFKELRKVSGGSKSTLSFHLKKLRSAKLIDTTRKEMGVDGKRKTRTYSARDAEKLASLLITYKSSFLDEAVDRFAELWLKI